MLSAQHHRQIDSLKLRWTRLVTSLSFFRLVIHLDDYTDRGHEWRFYEQAEIIDYDDWKSDDILALPPNLQFRKFQGLFGNTKEIGCAISGPIIGVLYLIYT